MTFKSGMALKITLLLAAAGAQAADHGATLYKSKCASCHGAAGEGKPAMKAPALKGTSQSADDIVTRVAKGVAGAKGPHAKAMKGITDAQAKAVADFIKSM
jgi:mono/diheme cytochrome c family protein